MELTAPVVLPEDVVLVPTAELSTSLRARVGGEEGDYTISRPGSRSASKVVDAAAGALLQHFRTPTTIVDAVIRFAREAGQDPEEILVDAFPLLQRLVQSRFLVEPDSAQAARIAPTLAVGQRIGGAEILRCVEVTEDTEIYQVKTPGGALAAAKVLRKGHEESIRHVLEREGSILEHLAGDPGPVPLDMGSHEERPYLLMQWCPGVPVSMIAAELRETPTPDGPSGLLQLCCRVLESYATLHARGVIHGDVHPRNLLVGPDGVLKIVDYGLARLEGSSTVGEPLRGGLVYFYEPELAQAFRLGLSRVVHKYSDG